MTLTVWGLITLGFIELLLYSWPLWPLRKAMVVMLVPAIAGLSGLYFFAQPNILRGLVLLASAYRILNLLRIVEAKMHVAYLRPVTLRSSWWLQGLQLAIGSVGLWLSDWLHSRWLTTYAIIIFGFAMALLLTTLRTSRHVRRPRQIARQLADRDLPSVSVCIPARNETLNLEDCLRSVLASNYPKLEVLVLDDASHDRTPDIIKSFAHDGVRFIRGDVPPGSWLAKNWAYQRLFKEASGNYLLFCGVDVRFNPESFRAMVQVIVAEKQQMISFIPENASLRGWRQLLATLLQPLRYAWEICLPRASFGRPPVLSSCWLVSRNFMKQYGGFAAVSRMITPESYFARQAMQQTAYLMMASNASLGVTTRKSVADQWDTAVRTRYPQLHKRPEFVFLLSLLQLTGFLLPFVVSVAALLTGRWNVAAALFAALLLYGITYSAVMNLTYRRFIWYGFIAFPWAVILDIAVRNYSLWRYEFKEVVWKGRDVSSPVMHVTPHLPDLP